MAHDGIAEIRAASQNARHFRPLQIGGRQQGIGKVSLADLVVGISVCRKSRRRRRELPAHIRLVKVCADQIGALNLSPAQICPAHGSPRQIRPWQRRTGKKGRIKPRAGEICLLQVGAREIGIRQVAAGKVHAGKITMGKYGPRASNPARIEQFMTGGGGRRLLLRQLRTAGAARFFPNFTDGHFSSGPKGVRRMASVSQRWLTWP